MGVIFNSAKMAPMKPAETPSRKPAKITGEADGIIILKITSRSVLIKDLAISIIEVGVFFTAPLVFKTITGIAMIHTTKVLEVIPIPYAIITSGIKAARGGSWSLSSTQRILTNPQVIGTFSTRKAGEIVDTIKGYYPAIISERDFNAVQALRVKRSKGSAGPTGKGFKNLFRGMARCHCGAAMHYVTKGANSNYLVCSSAIRGMGCEYKPYRYEETERFLIMLLSCLNYDKLNDDSNSDIQHELNGLILQKGELESKVDNLSKAVEMADDNLPVILGMLTERTAELKAVVAQIKLCNIKLQPTEATSSRGLSDMREILVSKDTDRRLKVHLFLANHVDVIEFHLNEVLISFKTTSLRFKADLTKPINPEDFTELYGNEGLEEIAGNTIFDRDGNGHNDQARQWEQFLLSNPPSS